MCIRRRLDRSGFRVELLLCFTWKIPPLVNDVTSRRKSALPKYEPPYLKRPMVPAKVSRSFQSTWIGELYPYSTFPWPHCIIATGLPPPAKQPPPLPTCDSRARSDARPLPTTALLPGENNLPTAPIPTTKKPKTTTTTTNSPTSRTTTSRARARWWRTHPPPPTAVSSESPKTPHNYSEFFKILLCEAL